MTDDKNIQIEYLKFEIVLRASDIRTLARILKMAAEILQEKIEERMMKND